MDGPDKKHIVLTGIKHSGKTSVGKLLAAGLGRTFIDVDRVLERLYDSQGRFTCREIYRKHGREFFRSLETDAVKDITENRAHNSLLVLAAGGGLIENTEALGPLKKVGIFIYLKEQPEVLFKRISRRGIPPFLDEDNPRESFYRLYDKRSKLLETNADIIFTVKGRPVRACAETLERIIADINLGKDRKHGRK
jgi:shikimate kinase